MAPIYTQTMAAHPLSKYVFVVVHGKKDMNMTAGPMWVLVNA